jgi:hypothetical protein
MPMASDVIRGKPTRSHTGVSAMALRLKKTF